jgi:hypothetical protein
MSDRFPTLAEAINTAVEMGLRNLSTMIPAKVVKWDADKQKANCQILIKQITEDEEGEREVASWPVVPDVPVHFMGAGDFRITFPVDVGTIGMLVFCCRSMDKWLAGDGKEVDPEFDHDHGLQDAVFVPGLRTFGSPLSPAPPSDVIEFSAGGTTNFVALANLVNDRLDSIQSKFDSHTHQVPAAGLLDGLGAPVTGTATAAAPASKINQLDSVAASKVKAE